MQIAISFPGCHRRGGVERVMLECVNHLSAQGHSVHAFASTWEPSHISEKVIRHQVNARIKHSPFKHPSFVAATQQVITQSRLKPDVTAGFGALSVPDSVVWMTSVHAAWLEISKSTRTPLQRWKQLLNPFHPIILHMEKRLLKGKRFRHLIALTAKEKANVVRLYNVNASDVTVIPNGFSQAEFHVAPNESTRSSIRKQYSIPDNAVVGVFVANEIERKGLLPLCRAISRMDSNIHLLAVGKLDKASILPELRSLGIAERIHFTGPANQVSTYYSAADFFALPTQYEAWGLVIIEALACGLPVLISRLAGASVAVQEGVNGLLLDNPGDTNEVLQKLNILTTNTFASANEIAATVEHFQWRRILARYEQVLQAYAFRPGRPAKKTTCTAS